MAHWIVGSETEQSSGEVEAGLLMKAVGVGERVGHEKRLPQEPVF